MSYYFQHLWCHSHRHDESAAEQCQQHANETLFDPADLSAYEGNALYFNTQPWRLFSVEAPFRRLVRAWADHRHEDVRAQARIQAHDVQASLLQLEYPSCVWVLEHERGRVVVFCGLVLYEVDLTDRYEQVPDDIHTWRAEIANFLSLTSGSPPAMHVGQWEGQWELQARKNIPTERLWQHYFNSTTSSWFLQEAGELIETNV